MLYPISGRGLPHSTTLSRRRLLVVIPGTGAHGVTRPAFAGRIKFELLAAANHRQTETAKTGFSRSVVECGSPLPLMHDAARRGMSLALVPTAASSRSVSARTSAGNPLNAVVVLPGIGRWRIAPRFAMRRCRV